MLSRKIKHRIEANIIILLFISIFIGICYKVYLLLISHPIILFGSLIGLWWLSVCVEAHRANKSGENKKSDWSDCMNP